MKIYADNKVHLACGGHHTLCGILLDGCIDSIDKVSCDECIRILNELKKEVK